MIPNWLQTLAYLWLGLSAISFVVVIVDVPRQRMAMPIMKLVWPLTTLYMGPIGLYAYWSWGRVSIAHAPSAEHPMDHHDMAEHMGGHHHPTRPFWQSVFVSSTHCGAGCSIGDIIGEAILAATPFVLAGSSLFTSYIVDFVLAYVIGIAFQYFSIVPMQKLTPGEGLRSALKADTASLIAYEIGMFAWMGVVHWLIPVSPTEPTYWFLMQISMMVGFVTSYPANWVLVRRGVKHAM